MSTHTQGPWIVTIDPVFPAEFAIDAVVNGQTIHIALVHIVPGPDEVTQANAALISAAPDLLTSAKRVLDAFGGNVPDWLRTEFTELAAAKLKAEGGPS